MKILTPLILCFTSSFLLCSVNFVDADTISRGVIEQNDDAEESVGGPAIGNVQRTGAELDLGNKSGAEQWVGLRFQDITIPAGATINSATIRFTAFDDDTGTLNIPIVGEKSIDAAPFRDVTPLTTRSQTTSSVLWNVPAWNVGDRGANTTTPNLAALLQEIVDQNGWTSGSPVVFLFMNDPGDTSERVAVSFDGDPNMSASIEIDFSLPQGVLVVNGTDANDNISVFNVTGGVNMIVNGVSEFVADINTVEINGLNGSDTILTNFPQVKIFGGGALIRLL